MMDRLNRTIDENYICCLLSTLVEKFKAYLTKTEREL